MTSRRELMRLLGLAPLAATSATKELAAAMSSPSTQAIVAGFAGSAGSAGMPISGTTGIFGKALGARLEVLRELAEQELWARRATRVAGVDADIAVLKSTSSTFKARKQFERDAEENEFLVRSRRTMWGMDT